MQHSYEGLDRAGGFDRVRLFAPLAHRDYRLLVGGMSVSLLGDGLFLVALAWQVYALSNAPTALASVGIAMTVPTITCLLIGGAVSDRYDRRRVMLVADIVRGLALAALAWLALSGGLRLWQLMVVAVVYGAATAFFDPGVRRPGARAAAPGGSGSGQLARPARPPGWRLAGPAVGGRRWARSGPAARSGSTRPRSPSRRRRCWRCRRPPGCAVAAPGRLPGVDGSEFAAGLRYVRGHAWLWATLLSAAVAYLLFMGPTEVLLPFIVKNRLHDGAARLG